MEINRERLAGMCFIAYRWEDIRREKIDSLDGLRLMSILGVRHWRNWMHTGWLLKNPQATDEAACRKMDRMLSAARDFDIEVVGMNHDWFCGGQYETASVSIPRRGTREYIKTLDDYKLSWYTLASRFKGVGYWEIGNEWNHDVFLNPSDNGPAFTLREKAEICSEMLYHASLGIRAANPKAEIIMGGLAALKGLFSESANDLKDFYNILFERMSSYESGYRACFDKLNWHPYFTPGCDWKSSVDDWVKANGDLYRHVCSLGYKGGIWITEFGFSDVTLPEKKHDPQLDIVMAKRMDNCFDEILRNMPYVEVVHYFRLFDDLEDIEWSKSLGNGEMEGYFGIFDQHFRPKAKALSYKRFTNACSASCTKAGDIRLY